MRARHDGFTLLELLVALSIFALVSVIVFTGLQASFASRDRTDLHADRLIELQRAFNILRQDLEQAVPRAVRDQMGDFDPKNAFQQTLDGIAFTRAGRSNPLGLERSSLERLGYGLREDTLVRSRWLALDQPSDPLIEELPLLQGVLSLSFRFLETDKQWVDQWPPPNSVSPDAELPHAVDVILELEDLGVINRIIVLPY